MEFPAVAVERAMTYHDAIMRALAGTWTWLKAADLCLSDWLAGIFTPSAGLKAISRARTAVLRIIDSVL